MNNFKIIFISIFIVSIFLKLFYISNYESSIDDNIVLQSILNQKNIKNIDKLKTKIYDTTKTTYNSFGKKFLRRLDVKYNLNNILYPLNNFIQFVIVPFKTTYSPFQYLIVPFLINSNYTITQNFFGGRIISFIFSVLTLILFFRLLLKYFSYKFNFAITYILILFAFSHEFFIYSIHMSSYMAGLLAVIILTLIAIKYIKENHIENCKISFIYGIFLGLLLLLQYQILYYIVPFLMTIIYIYFKKNNLKSIFYLVIGFAIIFIPIYLLFLSKHINHVSDHWAHGAMLKYFYPNEITSNINKVYYMLYFFISNFFLIVYNLISFSNYKFISYFLCFINIYFLFKGINFLKINSKYHILYVFLKFFTITYFILILSGKITFSPTRHSLILLPLIFLLIFLGISSINLKLKFSIYTTIILFIIMLFSNITYFNNHLEPYLLDNFKSFYLKNNNNIITTDFVPFLIIRNEEYKNILYYNNDTSEISITNKSNFNKQKNISFISNKYELNKNVYNSYYYLYKSNDLKNFIIKDSSLLYTKRTDEIHNDFNLNDSIYFYNIILTN